MTVTYSFFAAKGGQGTSVVAAAVAIQYAAAGHRVLLVDSAERADQVALIGYPNPDDPSVPTTTRDNLDVVVGDVNSVDSSGYNIVVVDAGLRRPTDNSVATLVTRCCFLALRHAMTVTPPAHNIIVIEEPGRASRAQDVANMFNLPVIATIPYDPAIARTIDAGLLTTRTPTALKFLNLEVDA
jgi:CO dehydrogenase nickel-insertion accessory protein CooC1